MKIKFLLTLLLLAAMLLSSCWGDNPQATQPEHTHTYEDTYSNDETHHWYKCEECGEKGELAEHVWNDGVITIIPTPESDGIKTFTCMECGRKKSEKVPYDTDTSVTPGPSDDVELDGLEFLASTFFKMDDKLPTAPLTLEADIYVDPEFTGRAGAIFGNYMGIRQDWLFEIYENGVPRFYYHDVTGNVKDIKFTNVDVRTGDWVHIAFTFDYASKTMSVYLNGELAQSAEITNDLAEDITTYRFIVGGDGRSNNSNYFKGQIKSIAAYSDVRTAEELAASAANGVDSSAEGILVHYQLNTDSGNDDILDLSPNGYNISKEWLDSHETEIDYSYSFAVVGDTQWLSLYKPEKMEGIYDWLIANKDSKKIAHVFGLGDITEAWNTSGKESEWINAQQYIYKLNGVIPYSVVRGNHDESKYFNKYFATEEYMSQYGGCFMAEGDVRNSYKAVTIGTTDYLFVTLDFGASDDVLEWASNVVIQYPNHRVIVTTHGYQNFDGERLTQTNGPSYVTIGTTGDVDYSVGDNGDRSYNNGEEIWQKFISQHPNIFLVMCGHTPVEDIVVLQSEGNHGNVVNQMLINPQWMDPQKDGVGMVCMLYFNEDGSKMEVEWISTDTGKYYQEHNQFVLDLTNSLNAPAHDFKASYNEKYHYMACDCGYIYNEEAHTFDGGVLNADGYMVYTCECGYQRIASATDDPVALALQNMLEKYYNNGVYYNSTVIGAADALDVFFNGDSYYDASGAELGVTANVLSLSDIILGKYGDVKLDLGWNENGGIYTSINESTLAGFVQFFGYEGADAYKVTVEEADCHAYIKLLAEDDSVLATSELGLYAATTLIVNYAAKTEVMFTKSNAQGLCLITPPVKDGYVAEYDSIILDTKHGNLAKTVYYSTVDVWDGASVSESLQGSGTEEDPFLVTSGADLAYIASVINSADILVANFSGKYFKMTQSIDLNGNNLNVGEYPGWSSRKGFYGYFDGNHCTIRGLNNKNSLFGTIETGYLKNLSVYGTVTGNSHEAVGGIVGYVYNGGVLENLTSYVTVNGVSTIGGVVGNSENGSSTLINCVNYGNVTGSSWNVGGIVGSGGNDITDCVNFGNVHSSGSDNVGGIAGSTKNTGKIEGCFNYGAISTVHGRAGGIVGLGAKPIINCVNYGSVTAGWDSAGILGYVGDGVSASVVNCVNYGAISGSSGMGGIFGFNHASAGTITITDCVNNGNVTGTWGVGGIAGNTKATVSGCVNNGTLNAKGELGGIVGKCYGKVTECTNNGSINGSTDIIGGIVGNLHDTTYADVIGTTNYQLGTVEGPNAQEIIGKQ